VVRPSADSNTRRDTDRRQVEQAFSGGSPSSGPSSACDGRDFGPCLRLFRGVSQQDPRLPGSAYRRTSTPSRPSPPSNPSPSSSQNLPLTYYYSRVIHGLVVRRPRSAGPDFLGCGTSAQSNKEERIKMPGRNAGSGSISRLRPRFTGGGSRIARHALSNLQNSNRDTKLLETVVTRTK